MSCIICLNASADARRSCSCSAKVCRGCLMELLNRGKQRCVTCGSRFRHSAIVAACRFDLQNDAEGGDSLAKRYVKLAIAYSGAGKPRLALRNLALAQHHAAPGFSWEHFTKVEIASNLLALGRTSAAESCLRVVMPQILNMPQTRSSGLLFAQCCTLLCKANVQQEKHGEARAWLRNAMEIEDVLQLDWPLAQSLQFDAQILSREGKLQLAKESLITAAHIMSRCETDACLKLSVQYDIAIAEIKMREHDPARARLSAIIPTLRRRKRDRESAEILRGAARALSRIVRPTRRLRRKTWPERVHCCEPASLPVRHDSQSTHTPYLVWAAARDE